MDNYHHHREHPPASSPAGSAHLSIFSTANSLRPSGSNRQHIPSSIPANTLSIVPTNTLSIRSIHPQNHPLSSPTHPHPDDPSSSSSPPQQSPDTDSPGGPALKQTPPLSDPPSVEPSSGAHRTLKSNATRDTVINLKAPKDDRERRKRNRVTPEQLIQLEAAFSKDRSPTSTERRELSNRIGMAERAVQIWFQNRSVDFLHFLTSKNTLNILSLPRRAKAKHQPPRTAAPTANPPPLSGSPPASPPLGLTQEESLTNILNEREGRNALNPRRFALTFIVDIQFFPVADVAIGHWRRIHAAQSDRDLVAYWAPQSQRLCWFIHSGGLSFRMDIPFSTVVTAKVHNKTPTRIGVDIELNKPPTFLIQQPRSYNQLPPSVRRFPPLGVTAGEWASCRDWTEDNQASKVLRHEVTGPVEGLFQAIQCLSGVLNLIYGPNITPPEPPEPRNDEQPPRSGSSVAINPQANNIPPPRDLSQSPLSTYREVHQSYTSIAGFPQQVNLAVFQPETVLHSTTLPAEMQQTSTQLYPPPYPSIHSQQFVSLAEPSPFPTVMPDSANPAVSLMNTHRSTLAQPAYQPQHSGSFTNLFSTPPRKAPQGRGDVNHTQTSWDALANSMAPTVSDSTLMSGFSTVSTSNVVPSTPMDSLVTRAPIPQHGFQSHLQGSPFQTSSVPFCQMPSATTPNLADWPRHPYPFYSPVPYIHPGHIQQDFTSYPVSH